MGRKNEFALCGHVDGAVEVPNVLWTHHRGPSPGCGKAWYREWA